jgi:cyanobactin maturation PatA/PatG family protease
MLQEHSADERSSLPGIPGIPGLQELWSETLGDPSVCVAILDGPVELTHPAFSGARFALVDVPQPSAPEGLALQHGTAVASIIFAQHQGQVRGIAPHCKGLGVQIFFDDGQSTRPCSQVDLARAILRASEAGCQIINISGGQYSTSERASHFLERAIEECARRDILVVAAAGNEGCACLHVPGSMQSVLAVGAMDRNGDPQPFSNWGYGTGGILAPGEGLRGAHVAGGVRLWKGTSFSTAVVSGVAALLMSLLKGAGMACSGGLIRSALIQTARGCVQQKADHCDRLLAGRLDIASATNYVKARIESFNVRRRDFTTLNHPEIRMEQDNSIIAPSSDAGAGHLDGPRTLATSLVDLHQFNQDSPPPEPSRAGGVNPSGCSCGGSEKPGPSQQIVFALGKLSFDYGTRARRLYFANAMKNALSPGSPAAPNIDDPNILFQYLTRRGRANYTILEGYQFTSRAEVDTFTWVLQIDDTPIYAISPIGSFAFEIQDTLVGFLKDQLNEGAERVSIPGEVVGRATLFTGETVPIIKPDIRGMYSWKTSVLAAATQHAAGATDDAAQDLQDFLTRVYDLTRNLGVTSQDRAVNYAATDALVLQGIFKDVRTEPRFRGLELDTFTVEKSPICRWDADCWDVHVLFYDPNNLQRARRGFRFTVDVSDVVPVILGDRKEFSTR